MKHIKLLLLATIFTFFTACDDFSSNSNHSGNEISQEVPQETSQETSQEVPQETSQEVLLRIACVGDSITAGTGLGNPAAESYPAQLANLINDDSIVENFGVKSTTLLRNGSNPYWNTSQFNASHSFNPDIVVIMLGTNDTKNNNWGLKDQFVSDYTNMINSYKNIDSRPVVYICYPPTAFDDTVGITDKRIKEELIPKIREVADANGVPTIDIYSALGRNKSLFSDNVHPSAGGARQIAEAVYQVIY